jgi:hypothetical protein
MFQVFQNKFKVHVMSKNKKICVVFLCLFITCNSVVNADPVDDWMSEIKADITNFKDQNNSFNQRLKSVSGYAVTCGTAVAALATAPALITAGTTVAVGGAVLYAYSLGLGTTANLVADAAYQIADEDDPQVKLNFMSTLKTFASDVSSNIISSVTGSGISRLSGIEPEVIDVLDNAVGLSSKFSDYLINSSFDLAIKSIGDESPISKTGSIDQNDVDPNNNNSNNNNSNSNNNNNNNNSNNSNNNNNGTSWCNYYIPEAGFCW